MVLASRTLLVLLQKPWVLFSHKVLKGKTYWIMAMNAFYSALLLLKKESEHLIGEGERVGFESIGFSRKNYRDSQRISFQSQELASLLWERIKDFVEHIVIDKDPREIHIEGSSLLMQGHWQPTGLNCTFRLCRYYPGGHFAPHNDGFFAISATERSLKTFMLYLNGDFHGGSTNFIDPSQTLYMGPDGKYCAEEKNILYHVQPETGMAIIFNHNRLHEGQRLENGIKYILRTDIMYKNLAPSKLSNNQDKAVQLMQEADRLEASGKCMEAMELYRRAFKLFPELEESHAF
ncbi:2OGFe(ii) oxygenase family oxidoreductase [Plakobranchus ocellatus]|uniref:2OGFe(Ii) oxygenase family oxidoreductase n=1 Tax=Plakobranchus ocellatus TaxID=259542 RepID=A0AAV4C3X7_9GAST|nr:2OGFe(ii) oxygenase family oxidoreductase [Plakobranchus ocellatus]